jgi:NAD(P)-dependent dehydrogenase (short-subunit alcohol dehydrogenase family)
MAKAPKHILITGTSTGIGYNATEALCNRGHHVWAALRKPEIMHRLVESFPNNLHILKMDVTSAADINAAFEQISASVGDAELILINNAGIAVGGPIEALPVEEWRRIFEVNFFAVVNITRIFLPLIRKSHGRVINISSISGHIAAPFLGPYCTSKFAIRAFTDALRREVSRFGVKVIAIEPGPIRTEIWGKSLRVSEAQEKKLSPDLAQTYGPALKTIRGSVQRAEQDAVPVEDVTAKIILAVEARHPKVAYLVGRAIHLQALLGKHLPTSLLDKVISIGLRKNPKEW